MLADTSSRAFVKMNKLAEIKCFLSLLWTHRKPSTDIHYRNHHGAAWLSEILVFVIRVEIRVGSALCSQ